MMDRNGSQSAAVEGDTTKAGLGVVPLEPLGGLVGLLLALALTVRVDGVAPLTNFGFGQRRTRPTTGKAAEHGAGFRSLPGGGLP
jgi:hypothetical protein